MTYKRQMQKLGKRSRLAAGQTSFTHLSNPNGIAVLQQSTVIHVHDDLEYSKKRLSYVSGFHLTRWEMCITFKMVKMKKKTFTA